MHLEQELAKPLLAEDDGVIPQTTIPIASINIEPAKVKESLEEFWQMMGFNPEQLALDEPAMNKLCTLLRLELKPLRSTLRWATLDSLLERTFLMPFLTHSATQPPIENTPGCEQRLFLKGRAVTIYSPTVYKITQIIRSLLRGLEVTTFTTIHLFFYGLLSYHLYQLFSSGRSSFDDLRGALLSIDNNGLTNLVRVLVQISPAVLNTLIGVWFIPTFISVAGVFTKTIVSDEAIQERVALAQARGNASFWYAELLQWVPYFPSSSRLERLSRQLRWQGRLSSASRQLIFDTLMLHAKQSHKHIQRSSMAALAQIAHSFHALDLEHTLPWEDLNTHRENLQFKAKALQMLEALSHFQLTGNKRQQINALWKQFIRVAYAQYLLWWLGMPTSAWYHLPFGVMKSVKMTLEIVLLINLIETIKRVLECPKQPGFVFGEGYASWSGDYTPECFTARLRLFRNGNSDESVDTFVQELRQYYLEELTILDLTNKKLTDEEATRLVYAVITQGAKINKLILLGNSLTVVPSDLLSNLSDLQILDLSANKIASVSKNTFDNLPQLQVLDLSNNQLTVIPLGAFNNLPRMQYLNLAENPLTTLLPGTFTDLAQLQSLALNLTQLTIIPPYAFVNLPQLRSLDFFLNLLLTTIAPNAFVNLPQLRSLRLVDNHLINISVNAFVNLPKLQLLDLTSNRLTVLDSNTFAHLPELQELYLDFNMLTNLSSNVFFNLPRLLKLSLSNNLLNYISPDAFVNLSQLRDLNLYFNQLTELSIEALTNLTQLQQINVGSNQLAHLSNQVFSKLCKLRSLDLSDNLLDTISSEFFKTVQQLEVLKLRENSLTAVPSFAFQYLPNLQILELSGNYLLALSSNAFAGLQHLTSLDLSLCRLIDIPTEAFTDLPQLQKLSLANNKLSTVLANAFMNLSQLQSLDLSYNQLAELSPKSFADLPRLQTVSLTNNILTTIYEYAFYNLTQLLSLDFSWNRLVNISNEAFVNLPQLKTLTFMRNQISDIPFKIFSYLPQLNSLDFRLNQLTSIPFNAFSGLQELQSLSLGFNSITAINSNTFVNLPRLQYLGLNNNNISLLARDAFSKVYISDTLALSFQHLDDWGVYNLTQCLPGGITTLMLNNNKISYIGVKVLIDILPCTKITYIVLLNNPVNTSFLNRQIQANSLRQQCEAQRCLNIWPDQVCEVTPPPTFTALPKTTTAQATSSTFQCLSSWSWTWFKSFIDSTLDTICQKMGDYAKDVVSSCPSYFDPNLANQTIGRPRVSYWNNHSFFASKTLSNGTTVNASQLTNISYPALR